jgi:hypothetical protein
MGVKGKREEREFFRAALTEKTVQRRKTKGV